MFRYLPEQASDFAHKVDWINYWITDISAFFTIVITGAAIYFAFRYAKRGNSDNETPQIKGSEKLEIIWTVVPTVIIIFVAVSGFTIHRDMRTPPANTLDINVTGSMWKWTFEYPTGKKVMNEFVVPVDKPVRLILRSEDVIHSFFIPAMRVKSDALPSMYTFLWFRPIKTGTYPAFCTEYCGLNHSAMGAELHVVPEAEYARWLEDDSEAFMQAQADPAELGAELYNTQNCVACHSLDGSRLIGPSFKGLWGKSEKLEDGSEVAVDENYVEKSILYPGEQIVAGYPNAMTPYLNLLNDKELRALIAFIKNVDAMAAVAAPAATPAPAPVDKSKMTPAERGAALFKEQGCNACHSVDGSKLVAPTFKGLVGRQGKLADGSPYVADEAYIKNSILQPQLQIVEGYQPLMPPYQGKLGDAEIGELIEFMKGL